MESRPPLGAESSRREEHREAVRRRGQAVRGQGHCPGHLVCFAICVGQDVVSDHAVSSRGPCGSILGAPAWRRPPSRGWCLTTGRAGLRERGAFLSRASARVGVRVEEVVRRVVAEHAPEKGSEGRAGAWEWWRMGKVAPQRFGVPLWAPQGHPSFSCGPFAHPPSQPSPAPV